MGVGLLVLGGLTIVQFDPVINKYIYKEMLRGMDGALFKPGAVLDIKPVLSVYFFNVTNKEEFLAGSKPILQEVGPYVYWQKWIRVKSIKNEENNTVSGSIRKLYFFDREASYGPESDLVTTLDVPMVTAVWQVRYTPKFIQLIFSSMLEVLKKTPFTTRNVSDLIWGYEDPLLKMARDILPPEQRFPSDSFGFFLNANNSDPGNDMRNYYRGTPEDMNNYMDVYSDKFKTDLGFWKTEKCNKIHGSDGTGFPPDVSRTSTLHFFIPSLCRIIPLEFVRDIEHYGIKGYRFSPPKSAFSDEIKNPDNACYCVGSPCIGGGLFNLSICQFGAPAVVSWPHYFQADQKYRDAVIGLNPDPEKHQFAMDIAPRTGSVLSGVGKAQINFALTNVSEVKPAQGLRPMIFPVVWFSDGVAELQPDIISQLRMAVNLPETLKTTLLTLSFIFGCVMFVGGVTIFVLMLYRSVDQAPRPCKLHPHHYQQQLQYHQQYQQHQQQQQYVHQQQQQQYLHQQQPSVEEQSGGPRLGSGLNFGNDSTVARKPVMDDPSHYIEAGYPRVPRWVNWRSPYPQDDQDTIRLTD
ncbi:CD36 family [Trinorchestia longiramus]|nr:CD36 family [Trinorchestia longiramus]